MVMVLYVVACTLLYFGQDHIIFFPDPLPKDHVFRMGEEVRIPVDEDVTLSTLFIEADDSKGAVIYFHGNRGNNRRCIRQVKSFAPDEYDIFMPDYRGYGKSDGEICSEQQFTNDAQKVYDFVRQRYPEEQIRIVGYSLGTGLASYLAAHNNPAKVILIAPYISFIDLKDRWSRFIPDFLVKYPMDNAQNISSALCSFTLVHGTRDEVIPFDSSEQLSSIDPDRVQLIRLEGVGHRQAIFSRHVREALRFE